MCALYNQTFKDLGCFFDLQMFSASEKLFFMTPKENHMYI